MFEKTVIMNFFIDLFKRNFFFTGESVCLHFMNCILTQARGSKAMFSPFVKIFFFLLKCASPYTSCIVLKISHGLHFSATKNLMTDLCSSLARSLPFFLQNKYFCKIKIIFAIDKLLTNAEFKFRKKIRKFCFSLKFPLLIEEGK